MQGVCSPKKTWREIVENLSDMTSKQGGCYDLWYIKEIKDVVLCDANKDKK